MERRTFLKSAGSATFAAFVASPHVAAAPLDRDKVRNRNQNRSTVVGTHGMVCASQPLAAMAGIDVLKAGGNAIDAAICTNAMLGLVEPMSCGIGGDLFAIVWIEKDRKLYGLNASGRSPYKWSLEAAREMNLEKIPDRGPLCWSVPGCVSGWGELHARFGTAGLPSILAAPIAYARDGFPISPIIAGGWRMNTERYPTLAKTFMPGGEAPEFGDIFRNPDLADSLESIATGGPRAYYEGDIAEKIVTYSNENGGRFSKQDFLDHEATWVEPVSSSYRGYDVWEIPPNGQGIAALQILNVLEEFDIPELEPNSAEHLHLFVEAKKLAFEDRAIYYADPDFADVPVEWLISKDYARERAELINPNRASSDVVPGDPSLDSDTVYLTAADAEGNMVSLIQSIYSGWGSHVVPGDVGFPIQNRGASFALDPGHRNRLEPHKRPFHTIIPAFMTKDGEPVWAFGVMGGDFQPQGHAQVVMNLVDFGMSVQQAGEQPRVRHDGSSDPTGARMNGGGELIFERNIPDAVKLRLAEIGHAVRPGFGKHGGYQSIWREDEPLRYFGGTDPRKDGVALGY